MTFDLVDVFASTGLSGNPLAVVHDAQGLADADMQALTRWLGFSETTFLLPPTDLGADYRVRIFTPSCELPFAGHPTLGSAHAWLAAGGVPRDPAAIVQECGVGLVPVRRTPDGLAFRAPPLRREGAVSPDERAAVLALSGVDPAAVVDVVHADNGPGWILALCTSAEAVLAAEPALRAPAGTSIGLVGPAAEGCDHAQEVRAFFDQPDGRLAEDPVTGSLNAAVAQLLFARDPALGRYVAAQGCKVGADGRVICTRDDAGHAWIAGATRTVSCGGSLALPG